MLSGRDKSVDSCQLCCCQRPLTFHHLIPRKMHRRKHFRTHYDREQLNRGIMICRYCHSAIHRLYDEMTLAKHYATLDDLLADAAIQKHVAWVVKKR